MVRSSWKKGPAPPDVTLRTCSWWDKGCHQHRSANPGLATFRQRSSKLHPFLLEPLGDAEGAPSE